jgi:hypothetical protein
MSFFVQCNATLGAMPHNGHKPDRPEAILRQPSSGRIHAGNPLQPVSRQEK